MTSTARAIRRRPGKEERLDRLFAALSHRTRRALLARLERAPGTITELAEPFDMSFPAVSKHVRVLERAGLVRRTVDGNMHVCALDAAALEDADRWIAHYRIFWRDTLDSLADYVTKERR